MYMVMFAGKNFLVNFVEDYKGRAVVESVDKYRFMVNYSDFVNTHVRASSLHIGDVVLVNINAEVYGYKVIDFTEDVVYMHDMSAPFRKYEVHSKAYVRIPNYNKDVECLDFHRLVTSQS